MEPFRSVGTMHPDLRALSTGWSFLESPRWHRGRLYVSDFYSRQVVAFAVDGTYEQLATVPGMPSGLGFDRDGELLVVSMSDRRLLRIRDGQNETVADLGELAGWHCNDMAVDAVGRAYVGNFGWDSSSDPRIRPADLIRVDPDGSAQIAARNLVFPNGIALADGGETLLVAETFAARITAFDVAADGSLVNRRVWAAFADSVGESIFDALASGAPLPDGIAVDAENAVWLGDAGGGGALRVAEGGEILERIEVGARETVFAVALGGEDLRTLFLCVAPVPLESDPEVDRLSRLVACRVEVAGAG
jgi:sugar lactone lactonase YvrE